MDKISHTIDEKRTPVVKAESPGVRFIKAAIESGFILFADKNAKRFEMDFSFWLS